MPVDGELEPEPEPEAEPETDQQPQMETEEAEEADPASAVPPASIKEALRQLGDTPTRRRLREEVKKTIGEEQPFNFALLESTYFFIEFILPW